MDAELRRKQGEPFFRLHLPFASASSVFADGWFARSAEAFARFFETPTSLITQTFVVARGIPSNGIVALR